MSMASNFAHVESEVQAASQTVQDQPVEAADMAVLADQVREYLAQRRDNLTVYPDPLPEQVLIREFGFSAKGKGKPEVILTEDVQVELGHPSVGSLAAVLTTYDPSLIQHGRISLIGPDLRQMKPGGRQAFAQVILLALDRSAMPDPFDLENAQYLMHRLPGYMVRSVPGKLWVRVGKDRFNQGLDLHTVGSALVKAYTDDFPGVLKAEIAFVTTGREDVLALEPIAAEAKVLSGRHKKLVLGVDGSIECSELNCEECEEKPVCDNLRDVVVRRRKQKKSEKAAKA
jgi:hypothetical protein